MISAFKCLYSPLQKWPLIRSFVGLDGIEPSASALSELDKGLVRRLVYPLTCRFVPREPPEDGSCHFVWARFGHGLDRAEERLPAALSILQPQLNGARGGCPDRPLAT